MDLVTQDIDEFKFIQETFDNTNVKKILELIKQHYEKHGKTTNIQIDVLVILFRVTESNRVFNLLFILHCKLLMSIVHGRFFAYQDHLYEEDIIDMTGMINEEFVRRVRFYKIPSETPFSGYCKDYLKKWLNRYTQLIVDKNMKYILKGDIEDNYES